MPGEVGEVGAEDCLGRKREWAVVEVGEFEVAAAWEDGFGDVGLSDLDAEVVVDGPEAWVAMFVRVRDGSSSENRVRPHPTH